MGMSLCVYGLKPPDEKWKKMKKAWDACQAAGVEPPKEVSEFFGWEDPEGAGVNVDIQGHECCSEWNGEDREGYEIDVSKLPKDTKLLRFYASY